jgi:membrane-associated phospholipid phosphatase
MTDHVPTRQHVDRSVVPARPSRGVFHDIRSPGSFARHPLVGMIMFLVGSVVFGLVTYHLVTDGSLLKWDVPLAKSMHASALQSPDWFRYVMIAGYFIGDQLVTVIGLVLAIYFVRQHCWQELTMLVCGFAISALLFLVLAHTFDRPRPDFEPEIWNGALKFWGGEDGRLPSYPSGHAMAAISSYGLLTYFLVPKIKSRSRRLLVLIGVLLLVVYVNFSRLFLCDHFLTDIIAGTAIGVAWLGLAQTVIELLFRRRVATATGHRPH